MEGKPVFPLAFLLKMLFTFTLGAGYKAVRSSRLSLSEQPSEPFLQLLQDVPIPLCAAVGMGAVFCGVTNSPITSLLICFELFGFEGMPYFLIAIVLGYILAPDIMDSIDQKIIYSKYKTEYINRKTH